MEKAVALQYTLEMPAPLILAKGRGELARRILKIAQDNQVRIVSMPDLAENLLMLEVGSLIPEEYYAIVAELLVFVHSQAARNLAAGDGKEDR
jgi:flagellar biosynthesis protein